jgi:hypothetical protein
MWQHGTASIVEETRLYMDPKSVVEERHPYTPPAIIQKRHWFPPIRFIPGHNKHKNKSRADMGW